MAFATKSYGTIRDQVLRDVQSVQPDTDIGPDSDTYARAAAVGATGEGLWQAAATLYRQIWPDSADLDELLKHCAVRNIQRKPASAASSIVQVTGQIGVILLSGSAITHPSAALVTTAEAVIGDDGTAQVPVAAVTPGTAANGLAGAVTVTSPPLGLDAQAQLLAPLSGGTDIESQAELLQRYLDDVRNPQSGGNDADYIRWAKAVEGVTTATVLGLRRGGGTVDVVITSAGGVASAPLLAAVQAAIDAKKPAGADVWAITPVVRTVDIAVQVELDGTVALSDIESVVQAQVAALVAALQPGDRLVRTRIGSAIDGLPGIADVHVIAPAGNVAASDDPAAVGWIRLGEVSVESMA
jgi:uncharacterized phage protein gp47/JayE